MARKSYSTQTRDGRTCHVGIPSKRQAERLARQWSREFPEFAPYSVREV
jgi:hypothetical protein